MADQRVTDIVREVVAAVRPEELPDFELVASAHTTNPAAAQRARRRLDEPTGSAVQAAGQFLTDVAFDAGKDLCVAMLIAAGTSATSTGRSWWRKLRGKTAVTPETVVPPMPPEREQEYHAQAFAVARERGLSVEEAEAVATELVRLWTRA